jgi:hypothetical protein
MKGDRFFEVLADGETGLLVFRKVILSGIVAYKDENEALKNMAYLPEYKYYFYSPQKGYTQVRISLPGLLDKFDKPVQRPVKKLLRKNKIKITGEESFVVAWKAVEKEGYKINF